MPPPRRVQGPDGVVHEFPGDATDAEIASALETLVPATPSAPAPAQATAEDTAAPWSLDRLGQIAKRTADPGIGAAKGAANTLIGLGEAVYRYVPGVAAVSDAVGDVIAPDTKPGAAAFTAAREAVQPTNTAQRAGYTAEQIAEFFTPVGRAGKIGKAALEVGKSGALTLAQTGSPAAAGVSAGLTAVLPGVAKVATGAASKLQRSAEKTVAQALGAQKEWAKSEAAKLAPEILRRGVRGSREKILALAEKQSDDVGSRLGALYTTAAQQGTTVSGLAIRGELQFAKDALMTPDRNGVMIPIEGAERVIKKLDRLEAYVAKLGDDIPIDKAAKVKTFWDKIVAKAGLYGPKAAANATDEADAWATREATSAIRTMIDTARPDVTALAKEYSFWKGLKDVLSATDLRTQAQGGGLLAGVSSAGGAASGFASGDDLGDSLTRAFVGAAAGRQFVKLVQSPWFRTSVSGPLKAELAKALASGNQGKATSIVGNMIKALPSQAKQALAAN